MLKCLAAALALACSLSVSAQTLDPTARQVQLLAPQLVSFAGSSANFESLALGLTQGQPVTLATTSPQGLMQIATFQPAGALSAAEAARALESARQGLITLGIATPSAQQLATALVGGTLPTAAGVASVRGVLPNVAAPIQLRSQVLPQPLAPNAIPGGGFAAPGFGALQGPNAAAALLPPGIDPLQATQAVQLASVMLAQQGLFNPTPEQLRAALQGGTIVNAAGSAIQLQGVLQGSVRQLNAPAPPGNLSNSPFFGTSDSPLFNARPGAPNTIGTVTVTPPANINTVVPDRPR